MWQPKWLSSIFRVALITKMYKKKKKFGVQYNLEKKNHLFQEIPLKDSLLLKIFHKLKVNAHVRALDNRMA